MTDETFDTLRPLMFSIAYRMLGSVSDAEDIVQEAYVRYTTADAKVGSLKAYLSAVVTRLSIDHLRSARVRRETYVGQWLPEPLLTEEGPAAHAEQADSLSMAFLLVLERLSPVERAVFLLHDVFAYDYDEIAQIVGKSEANCRQLASRARKHLDAEKPRFETSRKAREDLAARFFAAAQQGDVDGLVALLAADVEVYGDGGGKAPQWSRPIVGADRVSRLFVNLGRQIAKFELQIEPHDDQRPARRDPAHAGRRDHERLRASTSPTARADGARGDQPGQAAPPRPGGRRLGAREDAGALAALTAARHPVGPREGVGARRQLVDLLGDFGDLRPILGRQRVAEVGQQRELAAAVGDPRLQSIAVVVRRLERVELAEVRLGDHDRSLGRAREIGEDLLLVAVRLDAGDLALQRRKLAVEVLADRAGLRGEVVLARPVVAAATAKQHGQRERRPGARDHPTPAPSPPRPSPPAKRAAPAWASVNVA